MLAYFGRLIAIGVAVVATLCAKEDSIAGQTDVPGWAVFLKNSEDRQDSFKKMLLPVIRQQNEQILQQRTFIESFFANYDGLQQCKKLPPKELAKLMAIAKAYKIIDAFDKDEYLMKIDAVPASLVLSQAALESGWGTSRLSLSANNIFGHKSFALEEPYTKSKARSGECYRVFDDLNMAIAGYMQNLNSHTAYNEFRAKRAALKSSNTAFTGLMAAATMKNYSEIGKSYIKMLVSLIKDNNLLAYDEHKMSYGLVL